MWGQYSGVSPNVPEFLMWHRSDTQDNTVTYSKLGVGIFSSTAHLGKLMFYSSFTTHTAVSAGVSGGAGACTFSSLSSPSLHTIFLKTCGTPQTFLSILHQSALERLSLSLALSLSLLHSLSLSSPPLLVTHPIFSMWSVMVIVVPRFFMGKKKKRKTKTKWIAGPYFAEAAKGLQASMTGGTWLQVSHRSMSGRLLSNLNMNTVAYKWK